MSLQYSRISLLVSNGWQYVPNSAACASVYVSLHQISPVAQLGSVQARCTHPHRDAQPGSRAAWTMVRWW